MPQADATVHVSVQRSFLAAVKQGSNSPPLSGKSPLAGKGSSPGNGMAMAYSASSEDGTSTSGWFLATNMHLVSINHLPETWCVPAVLCLGASFLDVCIQRLGSFSDEAVPQSHGTERQRKDVKGGHIESIPGFAASKDIEQQAKSSVNQVAVVPPGLICPQRLDAAITLC